MTKAADRYRRQRNVAIVIALGLLALLLLLVFWPGGSRVGIGYEAVWGDDDDATVSTPGGSDADGTCTTQRRGVWSNPR